jgi:hypothetical protein
MCCSINCFNDKTRYTALIVFHSIDLIFFIIRLSLVSNDISKGVSDTISFLVPILLFDLIASVPLIICDIIYIIMRHCVQPLIGKQSSSTCLWRFGTITCIRLNCHNDRPQGILLMRILLIIFSFILRFICFVIGASCSARFKFVCTAYTVIAAFALVSSVVVIVIEFIHFFRLWNYNPTETKNTDRNAVRANTGDALLQKTHRGQLAFIPPSLLNDENADGFRHSRCENGIDCKSEKLHHHLFYHSLESDHDINFNTLPDDQKESFIAFYQTNKQEAFHIAQHGFPYGDDTNPTFKEYLRLRKNIFFTRSCTQTTPPSEAIICVRLNLKRVTTIANDQNLNLNTYFGLNDGQCDTIYAQNTRRLYLRMPAQIETWIITINANVNDVLDGPFYQPCV